MCHPWMEAGGQVSREIEESFALHAELEDHVAGSMGVIGGLFGSLLGGRVGTLGGAAGGAAGGVENGVEPVGVGGDEGSALGGGNEV